MRLSTATLLHNLRQRKHIKERIVLKGLLFPTDPRAAAEVSCVQQADLSQALQKMKQRDHSMA
jgi:hypothetical protein